jgi:AcrR family transcriptional regulator
MVIIYEVCMGILERKEREKAERRKIIMKCARKLILARGAETVSMEDIAQKAELSKATLYLYFPGKDVLFRAICEEAADTFIEYIRPWLNSGISGLEALKRYWVSYLDMFGETDEMIILFYMHRFLAPLFCDKPSKKKNQSTSYGYVFFDLIRDMIEKGKEEQTFDPDLDSAMAARTILSLFSGIVESVMKVPRGARKSPELINEMRSVFQIMLRGIAREGVDRSSLVLPAYSPGASKQSFHSWNSSLKQKE